jgi:hypothetical protein
MLKTGTKLFLAITLLAFSGGCDQPPAPSTPTTEPPAAALLPTLPGYTQIEGQTITSYLGKLSEGAALLTSHPELAATIAAVDGIIGCYQQVGAVRARIYSDQASPLSAGTVAIGDRNTLLDPINLFRCVAPNLGPQAQPLTIKPCAASYTLSRSDNDFYILYAGTTPQVCQALCAHLESCPANKP